MTNKVVELFGYSSKTTGNWLKVVMKQWCPFTNTKCFKIRKSQPDVSIGTCTVEYGTTPKNIIICPNRLLERKQVFTDCFQLLTLHEPGNELHIVPEVSIPGGSIDYFLVSARKRNVKDFVAIEFQTLDTTGTVWPERQRLLNTFGIKVSRQDLDSQKGFGMNWKMTAKTILVQLHHKVRTLEHINKRLVLVLQDHLLEYMRREFSFGHLTEARIGDSMHFHSYSLHAENVELRLELHSRSSTDADGIAKCLGLQAESKVELQVIVEELERKLSDHTLFELGPKPIAHAEDMPSE